MYKKVMDVINASLFFSCFFFLIILNDCSAIWGSSSYMNLTKKIGNTTNRSLEIKHSRKLFNAGRKNVRNEFRNGFLKFSATFHHTRLLVRSSTRGVGFGTFVFPKIPWATPHYVIPEILEGRYPAPPPYKSMNKRKRRQARIRYKAELKDWISEIEEKNREAIELKKVDKIVQDYEHPTNRLINGSITSNVYGDAPEAIVDSDNEQYVFSDVKDNLFKHFSYTGSIQKGRVLKNMRTNIKRILDAKIIPPTYYETGKAYDYLDSERRYLFSSGKSNDIPIASEEDIRGIREACFIARKVLDKCVQAVVPGVSTEELDQVAFEETISYGAYPSPLNYHKFPKSICTSVNEIMCHGIPDLDLILKNDDIITIDVTVFYKGYHGDCAETVVAKDELEKKTSDFDPFGNNQLLRVAKGATMECIRLCKPGENFKAIGEFVDTYARSKGYMSANHLCGHGIGKEFHEMPSILFVSNDYPGQMKEGMVFTIEPVICSGSAEYIQWPDLWTIATKDGSRAAQFEHTILITHEGCEILTCRQQHGSPNNFLYNF